MIINYIIPLYMQHVSVLLFLPPTFEGEIPHCVKSVKTLNHSVAVLNNRIAIFAFFEHKIRQAMPALGQTEPVAILA